MRRTLTDGRISDGELLGTVDPQTMDRISAALRSPWTSHENWTAAAPLGTGRNRI